MAEFFKTQEPVNYEQKSLCVLLLDTSHSMEGAKLKSLQNGIEVFHDEISNNPTTKNRLEVAIVAYSSTIDILQQPALVSEFLMPTLKLNGATSMGGAIDEAIEIVGARKSWYKMTGQPYYRPWIINMTDGEPTDIPNIFLKGDEIRKHVDNKNFFFFNVGVKDANMTTLANLSSSQMPPEKLEGLKFAEFFQWLSASIQMVATSTDTGATSTPLPTPLPSKGSWMEGFNIS
ncbi:MAG: hypothetical protein ACJA1B_001601 [Polaribacter sp.]|jgi:uncharacterized protein YegL